MTGGFLRNSEGKFIRNPNTGAFIRSTETCNDCGCGDCFCNSCVTIDEPTSVPCCLTITLAGLTACPDCYIASKAGFAECWGTLAADGTTPNLALVARHPRGPQAGLSCSWIVYDTVDFFATQYEADWEYVETGSGTGIFDAIPICDTECTFVTQIRASLTWRADTETWDLEVRGRMLLQQYSNVSQCRCDYGDDSTYRGVIIFRGSVSGPPPCGGTFDPFVINNEISLADCGSANGTEFGSGNEPQDFNTTETRLYYGGTATISVTESQDCNFSVPPFLCPGIVIPCREDEDCFMQAVHCGSATPAPFWIAQGAGPCEYEHAYEPWYFTDQGSGDEACYYFVPAFSTFGTEVDLGDITFVEGCQDEHCFEAAPPCKCWWKFKATYTLGPCAVTVATTGPFCDTADAHTNAEWVDVPGECAREWWEYIDDCPGEDCDGSSCDGEQPEEPTPPGTPPREQCPDCGTCECFDCCPGNATATISGTNWCYTFEDVEYCLDGVHDTLVKQAICHWHNFANPQPPGFTVSVFKETSGPRIGKWTAVADMGGGCTIEWYLESTACCPFHSSVNWSAGTLIDPGAPDCPGGISGGTFSFSC